MPPEFKSPFALHWEIIHYSAKNNGLGDGPDGRGSTSLEETARNTHDGGSVGVLRTAFSAMADGEMSLAVDGGFANFIEEAQWL